MIREPIAQAAATTPPVVNTVAFTFGTLQSLEV